MITETGFHDFIPHLNYLPSHPYEDDERMRFYREKLNHIKLDFFILDDATEGLSQRWRIAKLKFVYGLSWAHRFKLDYDDYTSGQKVAVWLLSHLGRFFKQTYLNRRYDRISRSASHDSDFYFLGNTMLVEIDRVYRKEWYTPVIELDYDGYRFMAPSGYDAILTELYGDYMTPPPVGERVPEHYDLESPDFKIDETSPYYRPRESQARS